MLDAMMASALKKLFNMQFRKRVSVEEQRAQKHDRFSRGRQSAYIIHEYFRATRAYEAVQGFSDLFSMTFQNDDVQDFDVKWDHALLSVSEMPSDAILEGLYKSKLQNSAQLRDCDGIVWSRRCSKQWDTELSTIENCSETSYWSMMRNRNFRARNDVVERGSVTNSRKGNKAYVERKVGQCFSGKHADRVPKETHAVSVMTHKPLETRTRVRDEKGDRFLPHPFEGKTDWRRGT